MGIPSWLLDLGAPASVRSCSLEPFRSSDIPARNLGSTEFEVDGWVTSAFVAQTLAPLVGVHPFPLQELMLMTATVSVFSRH